MCMNYPYIQAYDLLIPLTPHLIEHLKIIISGLPVA
jgi:hypothetical protein